MSKVLVALLVIPLLGVISPFGASFASSPTASATSCYTGDQSLPGPEAPTNLQADVVLFNDGSWIVLTWDDNSAGEACFVVERRPGGDLSSEIISTPAADTTCLIDASQDEGSWHYRVYAADATTRSGYSNEAAAAGPIDLTPTGSPITPGPTPTPIPGCAIFLGTASSTPTASAPHSPTPTVFAPERGDLNCDGSIDQMDIFPVLRHSAGLNEDLPVGCPPLSGSGSVTDTGLPTAAIGFAGLSAMGLIILSRRRVV